MISAIISGALGIVLGRYWKYIDKKATRDQETFDRINKILSYDILVNAYEFDFGDLIPREYVSTFSKFIYESDNPSFYFLDKTLELKRRILLNKIQSFTEQLSINTFPANKPGLDFNEIPRENTKKWSRYRKLLNEQSVEIFMSYSDLQKTARKKTLKFNQDKVD